MHLLLVRHGETQWNVERRIQGWSNSALTERGHRQIEALGHRLRTVPIAAVYTSDSTRTEETGRAAIEGRSTIPFVSVPELRETSWGEWEGKTSIEISADDPSLWSRFVDRGHEDPTADQADWEATTLVPGGETLLQASTRINSAISKIISEYIDTDSWVLIVGHGGSLRFVITSLLKLRPASAKLFHLDNASITHVAIDRKRTVFKQINDRTHWSEDLDN